MSLTGTPLLVLSLMLAVLSPVACLLLWDRLLGPPVVRMAGRLMMIALCQLTALLLAGLMVNDYYQLYASWADLFGSDINAGGQIQEARGGTVPHAQRLSERVHFAFDGGYRTWLATVTGPSSGVRTQLRVWTPPQYDLPRFHNVKFPVIELFPGFPGTPTTWFSGLDVGGRLTAETRGGQAKPFILVAPVITVQPGRDTECTDIPNGPRVATWLTRDVREIVTDNFRALSGTDSWGTMGYSTGGFCAAKLTLQYPQLFHAGVSMSGYFQPIDPQITHNPALARANTPYELVKAAPPVSLLLAGTQQDAGTAPSAEQLKRDSKGATKIALYILPRGGHNTGVWKAMLPRTLQWLSRELSGNA
jgi:enterochelin esterase-like enzyme